MKFALIGIFALASTAHPQGAWARQSRWFGFPPETRAMATFHLRQRSIVGAWCADSAHVNMLVREVRDILDGIDSVAVLERSAYWLPVKPGGTVRAVTDESICERAVRAYYRHELGPGRRTIMLVSAGGRYIAWGALRAGEWSIVTVFTRDFEVLSNIAR